MGLEPLHGLVQGLPVEPVLGDELADLVDVHPIELRKEVELEVLPLGNRGVLMNPTLGPFLWVLMLSHRRLLLLPLREGTRGKLRGSGQAERAGSTRRPIATATNITTAPRKKAAPGWGRAGEAPVEAA